MSHFGESGGAQIPDNPYCLNMKYLSTQKKMIKNMEVLLKMRLRTECPNSMEVLNELNSKLLNFSEICIDLE